MKYFIQKLQRPSSLCINRYFLSQTWFVVIFIITLTSKNLAFSGICWNLKIPCTIRYHLYNLRNVKNIHGRVLVLVNLQAATLLKVTLLYERFTGFSNCTNGNKPRKAPHSLQKSNLQRNVLLPETLRKVYESLSSKKPTWIKPQLVILYTFL